MFVVSNPVTGALVMLTLTQHAALRCGFRASSVPMPAPLNRDSSISTPQSVNPAIMQITPQSPVINTAQQNQELERAVSIHGLFALGYFNQLS